MNETIGVKGGKNDLRRRLIITKKEKAKLLKYQQEQKEKELVELERKVKNQQIITFLATIPIATIGQVYTTLTEITTKKKELALKEAIDLIQKENIFSEQETNEIIIALQNGSLFFLEQGILGKLGISIEEYKRAAELDLTDFAKKTYQASPETKDAILKVLEITLEEKQEQLLSSSNKDYKELANITNETKLKAAILPSDSLDEKLNKLKNHKIVDEYEKKLKDVRTDLRQLIFEYNLISDASDHVYDSKDAEDLLEKLNGIIQKIEELKKKIDVPDIDKYDDNYLYTLISDYIEEFKNKKFVDEIKDSALYIMISEKLEELDSKKDILHNKIETKKNRLEIDESRIEEIRENYFSYEKFNNSLLIFQAEQDKLLDEIRDKMSKATTIEERVEVQVVGMQRQSRRLLNILAASMMLPGARSARTLATMTATYLYFMRNIMRPQTVTRRYKTVNVTDYHKEIESSISQLDDVSTLLKKTSHQIDATIKEFEKEFKEYIDVIPECRKLFTDLEKIKAELAEKEYELARIKKEQELALEKNDLKVKRMTYEVPV